LWQRGRDGFENNPYLDRLREYAASQNAPVVAICAKMEAEMADMSDEDRQMFLAEIGQDEPGLNRLIRAASSCWACRLTSPPA
jgi:ribosome-binding ATPase YchF (GTP1/OBG family)